VATEAIAGPTKGAAARVLDFLRDVRGEVRKVTWPTWDELKKATGVIIVFVIALGILIGAMDWIFQATLVKGVARLF